MKYTEEEKKDIEMCNIFVNQNAMISYVGCDEKGNLIFPQCDAKPIQTLLNLIEKQQKENEKYKQIINKAIEYIGIDEDTEKTCEMYDVNGIEILKILNEIKGE